MSKTSAAYLCNLDIVEPFRINSISMEKLASVENLDMEAAVEMKTDLEIYMIVKKDVWQSHQNVRDQNLLKKSGVMKFSKRICTSPLI